MIDFDLVGGGRITVVGGFVIVDGVGEQAVVYAEGEHFHVKESATSIRQRMGGREAPQQGYGHARSWG